MDLTSLYVQVYAAMLISVHLKIKYELAVKREPHINTNIHGPRCFRTHVVL